LRQKAVEKGGNPIILRYLRPILRRLRDPEDWEKRAVPPAPSSPKK